MPPVRPAKAAAPVQQVEATRPLDRTIEWVKPLVAGRVQSAINSGQGFDEIPSAGGPPQTPQDGALKLYCRSADCVEAATGVRSGQILDLKA